MFLSHDPRNNDLMVMVNGAIMPMGVARISPRDAAVLSGDAVIEQMRVHDGRVLWLDQRIARLRRSAHSIAIPSIPSAEELYAQTSATLEANELTDNALVTILVSRGEKYASSHDPRVNTSGPTVLVIAEHAPKVDLPMAGARLTVAGTRLPVTGTMDARVSATSRIIDVLAAHEATHAGVDDVLMLDADGMVARAGSGSFFIVDRGRLLTPPAPRSGDHVLRSILLHLCDVDEMLLHVEDLRMHDVVTASEAFIAGTIVGIVPVSSIDGRTIGHGEVPGPMTQHVRELYDNLIGLGGIRVLP